MDEQYDDLAIEIVSLNDEPDRSTPSMYPARRKPLMAAHSMVAPRFSRRQRRLQAVITTTCVVLIVGVFLGSISSVRAVLGKTFTSLWPATSPAALDGVNAFYVDGTPSWGQLLVDGHLVAHLPKIGSDAPLQLASGQHHLVWQAAPFRSQACVVSIPINLVKDTCSYNKTIQDAHGYSVWLLTFSVSLALLPSLQRMALVQRVQQALDQQQSSILMHPHELYAIATSYAVKMYAVGTNVQKATQPMMAAMHFQIDTDASMSVQCIDNTFGQPFSSACVFDGQDCRLLCSMPDFVQMLTFPASAWIAFGVVHISWTYMTFNGQRITSDQPDRADVTVPDAYLMPLSISWLHGMWVVRTPFMDANLNLDSAAQPACLPAQADFNDIGAFTSAIPGNLTYTVSYHSLTPSNGCLVAVMLQVISSGTASAAKPSYAYCLQRFGVFVAVNAVAHKLWPTMPMADQYETAFAQQLQHMYQPQPFSSPIGASP